jgi:NADP-dependent 3-hydroxy acid dehydrogenase YdfG
VSRLEGTVALVTGASSGIGEAVALTLAQEGATVALVARRRDRLAALAARIEAGGASALAVEADLTQGDAAEAAVRRTVERFGRLDILVNSAGVMFVDPTLDASAAEWEQMFALNVLATMACTRAALPHLLVAAGGAPRECADVVNISSVAGRVSRPGLGGYSASKHAVCAFSESLRLEVSAQNVRVSVVEPGLVATDLLKRGTPERVAHMDARRERGEMLEASDVAEIVGFIVTRRAHLGINEILIRSTKQP